MKKRIILLVLSFTIFQLLSASFSIFAYRKAFLKNIQKPKNEVERTLKAGGAVWLGKTDSTTIYDVPINFVPKLKLEYLGIVNEKISKVTIAVPIDSTINSFDVCIVDVKLKTQHEVFDGVKESFLNEHLFIRNHDVVFVDTIYSPLDLHIKLLKTCYYKIGGDDNDKPIKMGIEKNELINTNTKEVVTNCGLVDLPKDGPVLDKATFEEYVGEFLAPYKYVFLINIKWSKDNVTKELQSTLEDLTKELQSVEESEAEAAKSPPPKFGLD